MELRQLGASELRVSPVIFGAWAIGGWMWGGKNDDEAKDAIRAAIDNGINTIDTAPGYGFGHSEVLVGQAVKGRRDKVIIATKCGIRWEHDEDPNFKPPADTDGVPGAFRKDSSPDTLAWQVENSLKRLDVDVIDLMQFHRPDPTVPCEQSMRAMEKLHQQGKIRAIGISNFDLKWHTDAIAAVPIASSQPPYSLIRRGIEKDILPFCREKKIGVICYSPMERGLLTGKVGPDRQFAPGDHRPRFPSFSVENRKLIADALAKIKPIADKHNASYSQLAVSWVIHQPGVTAALVGARNAEQAAQNAQAMNVKLSEDECRQMRAAFDHCAQVVVK